MCGENPTSSVIHSRAHGSSPRVRGKLSVIGLLLLLLELIPARAGKTGPSSRTRLPGPAHPRVCGENEVGVKVTADLEGSSPRVRGKRFRRGLGDPARRLIPACAGKTQSPPRAGDRGWAHPRLCGENAVVRTINNAADGSSPRVRGKPRPPPSAPPPPRLIPACAGKTGRWSRRRWRARAHPRVCGENARMSWGPRPASGSSPRVRGKLELDRLVAGPVRLIPACAGKTSA